MGNDAGGGTVREAKGRRLSATIVGVVVVLGLAIAVARNWGDILDSWRHIGPGAVLLSLGLAVVGIVATWFQWRIVLGALDVHIPPAQSARVFFLSQLGKYVPGSVWPVVVQMESGRRYGASRTTMAAGNIITIATGMVVAILFSAVLLPFSVPGATERFGWVLLGLPAVALVAHPQSSVALIDWALKRVGRPPLGLRPRGTAFVQAYLWSVVSWTCLGGHVFVLARTLGAHDNQLFTLSTGGIALAVSCGILFIPAPAGAGAREGVLLFVLAAALDSSAALAVVVLSRALLVAADIVVALLAVVPRSGRLRA